MYRYFFDRKHKKFYISCRLLFSMLLSAAFLFVVYHSCGIWFETNDDVLISAVLSGQLAGQPDYHINFIAPIITVPIAGLYTLFPSVPWWGIFLLLILAGSLTICFFSVSCKAENIIQLLAGIFLILTTFVAGLHILGQAQFTSCAMLLAIVGYVVVFSFQASLPSVIAFAFCEAIACALRMPSMLIIQPLGCCLIGSYLAISEITGSRLKKFVRFAILCVAVTALSFGLTKITFLLSYRNEQWISFKNFDTIQVALTDYEKEIPYSDLESVLVDHGISEDDYIQFLHYHHWYPDIKVWSDCIDDLLPLINQIRKTTENNPYYRIAILQLLFLSGEFWHLHQITLILFCFGALFLLLEKHLHHLLVLGCGFCGYFIGIAALAYRNRFVLRVMMPYYAGTILFLTILFYFLWIDLCQKPSEKHILRWCFPVFAGIFLCLSLYTGKVQFSYVRRQNTSVNKQYYTILMELFHYCDQYPDKRFILDMDYTRNCSTDILEKDFYTKHNCLYSGSWFSGAPVMIDRGTDYLDSEYFYYLVYEAQEWKGLEGLEYYRKRANENNEPELSEQFRLQNGATIWVYRVKTPEMKK